MSQDELTDRLLLREIVLPARSDPLRQISMSPAVGDTPESKSASGFASVFKSLTTNRSSRTSNVLPASPSPQVLNEVVDNTIAASLSLRGAPDYEQLYKQLGAGNDLEERLAAAESLRVAVQDYPLSSVTSVFKQGKDLINPSNIAQARRKGFELLTACVQQSASTDPERLAYFRVLTATANSEDFHLQLASVVELAKHGKDLAGFHYEILPLLTTWLRDLFGAVTAARKTSGRGNRPNTKAPLGEETNLALLFVFVVDVIKFNFNVSSEDTTADLIDVVLSICTNTPVAGDLRSCINVIDAIITYGDIPSVKLLDCVKVLCSIHCLVDAVQAEAWRSVSNLCRSHNGETTVRMLLKILREPPLDGVKGKQSLREIRGALSVLKKLFAKDGKDGYPLVPLTLLMGSLSKVMVVENTKVENDVVHLILSLFDGDQDDQMKDNVMEEDWSTLFEVVVKCSRRALQVLDGQSLATMSARSPLNDGSSDHNITGVLAQALYKLILRIETIMIEMSGPDFFQKDDCIKFFVKVHQHLPESCAKLVIDYYMEYRCCFPSDLQWKTNSKTILDAFFRNRSQPVHIRLHALKAITNVYEVVGMLEEHEDQETTEIFVTSILDDIRDERDISVLQEVILFAVNVAETEDDTLFTYVIDTVRGSILNDQQSPLGSPPVSRQVFTILNRPSSASSRATLAQTPSNVVTRGLVEIFMRATNVSAAKAVQVFETLLWITKSHECETDARLSALKILCRLRADWAYRIFLTPFTESDGLAASLYRTPASLARKHAADELATQHRGARAEDTNNARISRSTSFGQGHPQTKQPSRTVSGASRLLQRHVQMWFEPDPDALPLPTSGKASSTLVSFTEIPEDAVRIESHKSSQIYPTDHAEDDDSTVEQPQFTLSDKTRTALDIANYLETVTGLIRSGCDWEVYSYLLVHLSSQLTNQALFRAAIPQIKVLREVLCDQIKNNSFQEPPTSSGLRRADVAICFFQILTTLMSYHEFFSKADQDDIIRTFIQGVGERTSKSCIHALSICCHELPGSVSKALVTILTKMSQIITQSHVAVHILEFLACLARMPNLYANFREDEFRIVFAICFRYLQYVRDQQVKENPRNSSHGKSSGAQIEMTRGLIDSTAESNFQPNTSDELPQYVYALAYHVIIFWFLSLKLADRAGQVSWITRNLVSVDSNGREKIDEQAQVTLDFMQRVAYADVDESGADPSFTKEAFGEIQKKRWIIGNSLITVEQATRGDWAQITKRQPSGTSCYVIQEKFIRPPPHQTQTSTDAMKDARHSDDNVKLPSHLLLQLSASTPQVGETMRPIPLPDDDYMTRAVASFNRSFTVDGHKVGVIYVGENQTKENEILANVQGSSDYTEFLSGLGTLTKLKGANFNTQGLDRSMDSDGEYTFCWRDRVTEIVFHVTTQMPTNLDQDPQCIHKKKHIGNDFVNIIFNNSGRPFQFDTFPSEFNYVNIIITPESRVSFVAKRMRTQHHASTCFYKVQVMSKPGFPEISPAAETKIVSLATLPGFIRLLALNASVFSLVWANREGGEHVSSWRNRLREINRIRDRYSSRHSASTTTSPPGTSNGITESRSQINVRDSLSGLRRGSVANFLKMSDEPTSQRSSILSTAETEVACPGAEESLVDSLDFTRWA